MGFHTTMFGEASCLITAVTNNVTVVGYANQLHIRWNITPFFATTKVVHLNRLTA